MTAREPSNVHEKKRIVIGSGLCNVKATAKNRTIRIVRSTEYIRRRV
jgi:hypothetical protein